MVAVVLYRLFIEMLFNVLSFDLEQKTEWEQFIHIVDIKSTVWNGKNGAVKFMLLGEKGKVWE